MSATDLPLARPASLQARGDYRKLLWAALALMVVTRLAPVLALDVRPTSDMGWYYQRALDLLATGRYAENGVSTAYWPIGYPAFLAAVMAVLGTSVLAGQIANVALSLASGLLLYRLCIRYTDSPRVAALAVFLLAAYPNHVGYSLGLYSEPLFTALLLLLCNLVHGATSLPRLAFAGVVAGLATLVKAQMLLLAPILVFMLSTRTWSTSALAGSLRQTVVAVILMAVVIAPWAWRNYDVMGTFAPVSTNGGMSLLSGNSPAMTRDLRTDYNEPDRLYGQVKFSVSDQVAADRRARAAAWNWIRSNPFEFIGLMPKKLFRLWVPDGESEWNVQRGFAGYEKWEIAFRSVRVLNQLYYFVLLAGCLFALRQCVRWREPQTLIAPLVFLYFTAVSLVFSGQSRYHAPLMPFVIGYAAWSLARLRRT